MSKNRALVQVLVSFGFAPAPTPVSTAEPSDDRAGERQGAAQRPVRPRTKERTLRIAAVLFAAPLLGAGLVTGCGRSPAANPNAITGLTAEKWTWVAFPEAKCRDGSSTGIGLNFKPGSNKLMIFLSGGGACFNPITCSENPAKFDAADFAAIADRTCTVSDTHCASVNDGIFDRTKSANPLADWSYVYVPYCTGDIHAGDNLGATVPGVLDSGTPARQQFVGYANIGIYLTRIVPTFPGVSQVLLTGASAGGFGAAANYEQVAKAFASVRVDMLDDSGPFMEDPYLAACQQENQRRLWDLDDTVLEDCANDCGSSASLFLDYARHVAASHPGARFGSVSSTNDDTTTNYFGFGFNNCTGFRQLSEAQFTAGLLDLRAKLAPYSNSGAFLFPGTAHTSIQTSAFYTRAAGRDAVLLADWVRALVNGTVTNVGP